MKIVKSGKGTGSIYLHYSKIIQNQDQKTPLDGNQLLYTFKAKFEVFDYNPECFIPLGWMIEDIIMEIFTSTAFSDKIKFNKNLFTKITDGNVLMYKGSLQDYISSDKLS